MLPELIDPNAQPQEVCAFSARWRISQLLAIRLHTVALNVPFGLDIISGWRSCAEEEQLKAQGRPAIPCDESTHTSCPATGADVYPTIAVTNAIKATLGHAAIMAGLRWGGGSPVDPQTGIPSDWNHLDLGPRTNP